MEEFFLTEFLTELPIELPETQIPVVRIPPIPVVRMPQMPIPVIKPNKNANVNAMPSIPVIKPNKNANVNVNVNAMPSIPVLKTKILKTTKFPNFLVNFELCNINKKMCRMLRMQKLKIKRSKKRRQIPKEEYIKRSQFASRRERKGGRFIKYTQFISGSDQSLIQNK